MLPNRMDDEWWRLEAACKGVVFDDDNFDKFFPEVEKKNAEAKQYCAICPVTSECLDYSLRNNIEDGTWGGMNAKERTFLRRNHKRSEDDLFQSLEKDWLKEDEMSG